MLKNFICKTGIKSVCNFLCIEMTKQRWKNKIKKACVAAGTYQSYFDTVIETLAGILETRDKAQEKFEADGGEPVVVHTNKAGAENIVKNPALVVVMDCNAQALAYWRDLGLTPMGLKRLGEKGLVNQNKGGGLAEALADLGI